jgi:hypothetical protein
VRMLHAVVVIVLVLALLDVIGPTTPVSATADAHSGTSHRRRRRCLRIRPFPSQR